MLNELYEELTQEEREVIGLAATQMIINSSDSLTKFDLLDPVTLSNGTTTAKVKCRWTKSRDTGRVPTRLVDHLKTVSEWMTDTSESKASHESKRPEGVLRFSNVFGGHSGKLFDGDSWDANRMVMRVDEAEYMDDDITSSSGLSVTERRPITAITLANHQFAAILRSDGGWIPCTISQLGFEHLTLESNPHHGNKETHHHIRSTTQTTLAEQDALIEHIIAELRDGVSKKAEREHLQALVEKGLACIHATTDDLLALAKDFREEAREVSERRLNARLKRTLAQLPEELLGEIEALEQQGNPLATRLLPLVPDTQN